jgi:hypothetical protein
MKRTIKLLAVVLAVTTIGVIVYDRSRSHDDGAWSGSALIHTARVANARGYRIQAAPKTVINLGRNRHGCTLTSATRPVAVCDIGVAFADVGLNGAVTFVGSAAVSAANGLSIDLGK